MKNMVSKEEIDKFNNLSNLPINLLDSNIKEFKNKNLNNILELSNFMSYDIYNDDFKLIYSGYPKTTNKYKLISILLKNNNYDFLGITTNTNIKFAEKILQINNFNNSNENCLNFLSPEIGNQYKIYEYKNLKVAFALNNNIITKIIIELISEQVENVLF